MTKPESGNRSSAGVTDAAACPSRDIAASDVEAVRGEGRGTEAGTSEPAQLVLDLGFRPATGAGDFLVSACNEAAVANIDLWPDWPHQASVIVGPASAGKSHLAAVWQARSAAAVVAAAKLADETVASYRAMARPALVVEDIDRGIASERVLFHILNHAREAQGHVLMTSRLPPGEVGVSLPDLRSRLRATPAVAIEQPDDAVLGALVVKLFADRQIGVEPNVVAYMLRNMERSFAGAVEAVTAIDRLALAKQRRVTRPLAAVALSELQGRQMED